jgi:hypothetical protein
MKSLTLSFDDDDFAAIQLAFARRQLFRDAHGVILPDGASDTVGALLAEICRGWIEMLDDARPG